MPFTIVGELPSELQGLEYPLIYVRFRGVVTEDDVTAFNHEMVDYVDKQDDPVFVIADVTHLEREPSVRRMWNAKGSRALVRDSHLHHLIVVADSRFIGTLDLFTKMARKAGIVKRLVFATSIKQAGDKIRELGSTLH